MASEMGTPKHGEIKCQGKTKTGVCRHGAYFKVTDSFGKVQFMCGVHSKGKGMKRTELTKMSKKEKEGKKTERVEEMIDLAVENIQSRDPGEHKWKLKLVKMGGLFPFVPLRPGWINIYPNFKRNWQGIGGNYPELSPMSLGPVVHGQPDVPDSKNIENFHQGSKFFSEKEDEESFKKNQKRMFLSREPQRHKFKGLTKNIPDHFVWIDKNKKEHHLTYIESRQFYCNFYERLARKKKQYGCIQKMLSVGCYIQLCGPDAFSIDGIGEDVIDMDQNELIDNIEKEYLSPTVPFGHERVLFTMLIFDLLKIADDQFPWRKHKTFEF